MNDTRPKNRFGIVLWDGKAFKVDVAIGDKEDTQYHLPLRVLLYSNLCFNYTTYQFVKNRYSIEHEDFMQALRSLTTATVVNMKEIEQYLDETLKSNDDEEECPDSGLDEYEEQLELTRHKLNNDTDQS